MNNCMQVQSCLQILTNQRALNEGAGLLMDAAAASLSDTCTSSRPPAVRLFGFAASFTSAYLHINNCRGLLVKLPGVADKSCAEGGEEEDGRKKRRRGNIYICMACRMQMHFSVGTIRGCSPFTACGS